MSDINAGTAFVSMQLRDAQARVGLKNWQDNLEAFAAKVKVFGAALAGVGAAIVGPLTLAANKFRQLGEEQADLIKKSGLAAEAMSAFGYAAQQRGSDAETFAAGAGHMADVLTKAKDGIETGTSALDKLGLTFADLDGLAGDDQFMRIAEQISAIKDPAEQTSAAVDIFGDSALKLMPLLRDGSKGISELTREAKALGVTMSTEDVVAAKQLGDSLNRMKAALNGLWVTIGSAVAPALKTFNDWMAKLAGAANHWLEAHKPLIANIFQFGKGMAGAGAAMAAFGAAVGPALKILGALGAGIGALFSPLFIATAAIAGLGYALVNYTSTGAKAFDFLRNALGGLLERVMEVVGGVKDAIAGGDIELAVNIMWLAIQREFIAGREKVFETWNGVREGLISSAVDMVAGVVGAFSDGWAAVQSSFVSAWAPIRSMWESAWDSLAPAFVDRWASIQSTFVNVTAGLQSLWERFTTYLGNIWEHFTRDVLIAAFSTAAAAIGNILGTLGGVTGQAIELAIDTAIAAAKAAAKSGDATADDAVAKIVADRDRQLAEVEKTRQQRQDNLAADRAARPGDGGDAQKAQIDADAAARRKAIEQMAADWKQKIGEMLPAGGKGGEALAAAEKALADARKKAADLAAAAPKPREFNADDLRRDVQKKKEEVTSGPGIFGSFSASALQAAGQGGDMKSIASRQLKQNEMQTAHLGELKRIAEENRRINRGAGGGANLALFGE
jgi:hypothetical protein